MLISYTLGPILGITSHDALSFCGCVGLKCLINCRAGSSLPLTLPALSRWPQLMRLVSWTLLIYSDVAILYPHLKAESCIQMVLQCLITPTTQKIGNTITLIGEKKMYISFVDRDMVMRYHWGLGIGHVYAHVKRSSEDNESDGQPILEQPTKAEAAVTQVMTSNPSPATGNNGSSLVEPTGQPLNIRSNRSEGNPAKMI